MQPFHEILDDVRFSVVEETYDGQFDLSARSLNETGGPCFPI